MKYQRHEEETAWIFSESLKVQEPKTPTVVKRGAVKSLYLPGLEVRTPLMVKAGNL